MRAQLHPATWRILFGLAVSAATFGLTVLGRYRAGKAEKEREAKNADVTPTGDQLRQNLEDNFENRPLLTTLTFLQESLGVRQWHTLYETLHKDLREAFKAVLYAKNEDAAKQCVCLFSQLLETDTQAQHTFERVLSEKQLYVFRTLFIISV